MRRSKYQILPELFPDGGVDELYEGLTCYFGFYNQARLHQSLDYRTPGEVYGGAGAKTVARRKRRP